MKRTPPQARIILADDHPLVLAGLSWLLSSRTGFSIVAQARDADQLLQCLSQTPCDVLVTDFHMPADHMPDGLIMLSTIRREYPHVRIIVLTALGNPALLACMRQVGALGILNKCDDLAELPVAIATVLRGKTYLGQSVREDMDRFDISMSTGAPPDVLSPSEIEVVRLYASGMSVSDVARHLHRSIKTVSTHKLNAMQKLGVRTDADLCQYATRNGLS